MASQSRASSWRRTALLRRVRRGLRGRGRRPRPLRRARGRDRAHVRRPRGTRTRAQPRRPRRTLKTPPVHSATRCSASGPATVCPRRSASTRAPASSEPLLRGPTRGASVPEATLVEVHRGDETIHLHVEGTRREHQPDHARSLFSADPFGLRDFRGRRDPRLPSRPSMVRRGRSSSLPEDFSTGDLPLVRRLHSPASSHELLLRRGGRSRRVPASPSSLHDR